MVGCLLNTLSLPSLSLRFLKHSSVFNELLDQFYASNYDINTIRMLKQINDQQSK